MPPASWAGLTLDRPRVMGVVNVTPDSFSDGGAFRDADQAVAAGLAMAAAGADIIDVGGESTRPGGGPADPERERERVVPVVRGLAAAGLMVSIDSRHAATMRAALDVGARIVNDVSGLVHDPNAASLVAERACPVVLMHMRGQPATMMAHANYSDVVGEVKAELMALVAAAERVGVARVCMALDPGIGFAKRAEHSIELLRRLEEVAELGFPLLVGLSRKGFIGRLSGEPVASRRVGGSLSAALFAVSRGASILRVHDVAETVQALKVWRALSG